MDKSNVIIKQLSDLLQLDGALHNKKCVFTDLNSTDDPAPSATSFRMYFENGMQYEVSVKLVHIPDEEEMEMINYTRNHDLHGRPRR